MADVTFFSDQINLFDFSPYFYEKLPENPTIPPPSLILPNPPFFDPQSPLIFQSNSDQGFHSPTSSDERSTVSDSGTYGLPPKRRAGRLKFRETRHPFFRGVRSRNGGKWVCEVREPHKKTRIWLGTYPTAEMAARAHDVAAIALRGPTALLNFPDSLWKLPMPESIAPSEIRRTAVEAAEKFRPRTKSGVIGVSGDCEVEKCETGSNWGEEIDVKSVKSPENLFLFEDEVFTQDQLFDEMAQAMLLSPPHWGTQEGEELGVGVVDNMGLWTYSI